MVTIANNTAAKLLVGFVGLAMVFSLSAIPARAQTATDLQSQIQALLAQVAALQAQLGQGGGSMMAGTGVCPYTWTRTLNMGATGADVMKLQQFLNSDPDTRVAASGVGSAGMETEYYGSLTGAAVAKFQSKYRTDILAPLGLVNATTYFGPSTMAKANMLCVAAPAPVGDTTGDTTTGDTTTSGDTTSTLQGGAGSIDTAKFVSGLNNEKVGEAQNDVEVAGLDIKAQGSDLALKAVNVVFTQGTASNDFEKFANDVSLWLDGTEIGRMDATAFTDSNDWSQNIPISGDAIIKEGDTGRLTVAVSGINNLDSADAGKTWTVEFNSIRYRDAQNAIISDSSTGDIGSLRTFTFQTFATAANVDFRIRPNDSTVNDSQTMMIDTNNTTTDVPVMSFTLQAKGDSDITLKRFGVTASSSVAPNTVISGLTLWIDGEEVASADTATSGNPFNYIFNDMDYTVPAGQTLDAEVHADLLSNADGVSDGTTLQFALGENQTDNTNIVKLRDQSNTTVTDADITGSVNAGPFTLRATGLSLSLISSSGSQVTDANTTANNYGNYTMRVKVSAFGNDVYIPLTTTRDASSTVGVAFQVEDSNGAAVTGTGTTTASLAFVSGDVQPDGANYVQIPDGGSATFDLTTTFDPASAGQYRVQLLTVGYNTTADTAPSATQTATPQSSYQTGNVYVAN